MPDELLLRRIRSLIAARRAALDAGNGWADYDEPQSDAALANLEIIQQELLMMDFSLPQARTLALDLLLDGDDEPNFTDDFKNRLFAALKQVTPLSSRNA